MQLGLPLASADPDPRPLDSPDRSLALDTLYFVRHRRARRYVVRVDRDGRVRVTIPRGGSKRDAGAFASRHLDWIRREQARVRASAMPPAEQQRLRALAYEILPARLHALAHQHGLDVARVTIRNQRSRWGSCGRDGHICLNWRLVLMPDWVRDYVIVHELVHLKRMDHSPRYWALVAQAYPDYMRARRWLRDHAKELT